MENKTKEHLASEHCDNLDIIGEDYNYNSFTSGYDSRQPEIDALKEEIPKWISVEDRLPAFDDVVIGFGFDDFMKVWDFCNVTSKGFKMQSKVNNKVKITHWQPLPNPPKQTKP